MDHYMDSKEDYDKFAQTHTQKKGHVRHEQKQKQKNQLAKEEGINTSHKFFHSHCRDASNVLLKQVVTNHSCSPSLYRAGIE